MINMLPDRNDIEVKSFLKQNAALSYFILVDYESDESKISNLFYQRKGATIDSVLALRKSGTAHFVTTDGFDAVEWITVLKALQYRKLIMSESAYQALNEMAFSEKAEVKAYISKLDVDLYRQNRLSEYKVVILNENDSDQLEELYSICFGSYSPHKVTLGRLKGRGICFGIFSEGKLVSSACTDFEHGGNALIVGVCTHPDYRNKGMARELVVSSVDSLIDRGVIPSLQYDNPSVGRLYENIGFNVYQRLVHISKY